MQDGKLEDLSNNSNDLNVVGITEENIVPGIKIVQLPSLASEMMDRETVTF